MPWWSSASITGIDAGPFSSSSTRRRRASSGHGAARSGAAARWSRVASSMRTPRRAASTATESASTRSAGRTQSSPVEASPERSEIRPLRSTRPSSSARSRRNRSRNPAFATRRISYQLSSLAQAIASSGLGDPRHQHVRVGVARCERHRVLVREQQPVAGLRGDPVQLDADCEQLVVTPLQVLEQLRRDVRARCTCPGQRVHVAQPTTAVLEVRFQVERDLATGVLAFLDGACELVQPATTPLAPAGLGLLGELDR